MRVLIVDDEPPARRKIFDLLSSESDVEIVGEAADGAEAVDLIRRVSPDLVFLDIQMPRLDGFEVIAEAGVEAMPLTVFVTAYDEHALRAFEVHAFDYLLKPFAASRLRQVLDRARRMLAKGVENGLAVRLTRLIDDLNSEAKYARRILVQKSEEREALIAVEAIDRIQAERNYVRFFTRDGEFLRRGALGVVEERLDPSRFLRINRSEIVRLDAIKELQPWFHGDYRVIMKDGTTRTWSRRFRRRAKDLF
ncbi:MAG: response regulator transcription factor [Vicinamibacteria bacterium]|nr:response regulator transcription factor [Vicinamibacteria bacterium]